MKKQLKKVFSVFTLTRYIWLKNQPLSYSIILYNRMVFFYKRILQIPICFTSQFLYHLPSGKNISKFLGQSRRAKSLHLLRLSPQTGSLRLGNHRSTYQSLCFNYVQLKSMSLWLSLKSSRIIWNLTLPINVEHYPNIYEKTSHLPVQEISNPPWFIHHETKQNLSPFVIDPYPKYLKIPECIMYFMYFYVISNDLHHDQACSSATADTWLWFTYHVVNPIIKHLGNRHK